MKRRLTSRERPKTASYLRLKNIQGTTIGNIWKFFSKKVSGKESHIAEKPKKRPFRLNKRFFLQTENFKNFKGVLFDKIPTLSCFSDTRKLVGQEVEQMNKKNGPIALN